MKICLNSELKSPHTLDELESFVTEIFTDVPRRPNLDEPVTKPFSESTFSEAYKPGHKSKLVKYCPIKDEQTLDFWFHIPTTLQNFTTNPLMVVGYLLGHEGAGSVLEKLKQEGTTLSSFSSINEIKVWPLN